MIQEDLSEDEEDYVLSIDENQDQKYNSEENRSVSIRTEVENFLTTNQANISITMVLNFNTLHHIHLN